MNVFYHKHVIEIHKSHSILKVKAGPFTLKLAPILILKNSKLVKYFQYCIYSNNSTCFKISTPLFNPSYTYIYTINYCNILSLIKSYRTGLRFLKRGTIEHTWVVSNSCSLHPTSLYHAQVALYLTFGFDFYQVGVRTMFPVRSTRFYYDLLVLTMSLLRPMHP